MTDRPLYTILGVQASATATELRKAYYQKALTHHPDKAGPGSEETFKQIQAAYDVLSDPTRREIYDKYGAQGLAQLGAAPDGVSDMLRFVGAAYVMSTLMCAVMGLVTLVVIFLGFLSAKVEGRVEWNWTSVFVPVYIIDVFFGVITVVAFVRALRGFCPQKVADDIPPPPVNVLTQLIHLTGALFTAGWIAFTVVLSAGLQQVKNARADGSVLPANEILNWWYYFIPALVAEGALLLSALLAFPRMRESLMQRGIVGAGSASIHALAFVDLLVKSCRVAGIFLIAARVSGDLGDDGNASWWVVFIPYYVMVFFVIVDSTLLAIVRSSNEKYGREDDADRDGAEHSHHGASPVGTCLSTTIFIGMPLATLLMIAAKLEGTSDIPLEQCFIPLFILCGAVLCTSSCLGCCLIAVSKSMADDIHVMEAHAAAEEERIRRQQPPVGQQESGRPGAAAAPTTTPATSVALITADTEANAPNTVGID